MGALLRATDPVRHRAYRAAAWRQIRHELAGAAGAARWASLADMIALVEEPLVREAFFPSAVQHYAVETARPEDRDAIVAIAARHEPPEEVALVRAWWDEVPFAFRVARDPRGRVVAFTTLCDLADVPQRLLTRDPLSGPWRRHLRAHPVPRGQQVLLARSALAHGTGQASSPCFAALLRDIERASLEAGPALRRIYSHGRGDELLTQLAPVGFAALPGCPEVELGGVGSRPIVCDFGPESVAGWLSGLAARDLPVEATVLDEDARELVLDGRRVALTKLECDVLRPPARARGPAGRARGAAARGVGLRVDRRLQRRGRRRLRPAPQARRPRGRAGDRARRRLPPAPPLAQPHPPYGLRLVAGGVARGDREPRQARAAGDGAAHALPARALHRDPERDPDPGREGA